LVVQVNKSNMEKVKFERKFLGKLKDFSSKEEQTLESKHLKAYIKGYERFKHGYRNIYNKTGQLIGREPKWHEVKQQLTQLG